MRVRWSLYIQFVLSWAAVACGPWGSEVAHAVTTGAPAITPESPSVVSLPTASAHWVFLQDSQPDTIGHIWIVDGDAQRRW